jgi:hypothetical protein
LKMSNLSGITSGIPQNNSNLKISSFRGSENTHITNTTTLARDIGRAYNSTPWNLTSTSMPDILARWIWSTIVPTNTNTNWINFSITYTNTTTSNINTTLYVTCDNALKIYKNKTLIKDIDGDWTNVKRINIVLKPGKSLFEFICKNTDNGGYAGLIFSARSNDGTVYFRSDNSSLSDPLPNSTKTFVIYEKSDDIYYEMIAPLDKLSTAARNSCRALYSLKLMNSSYTGPVLNIRRSSDNTNSDFYSDLYGKLNTLANGYGTNLTTWLNGSTAFVQTWYDQSGNGRHATTNSTSIQPTLIAGNNTNEYFIYFDGSQYLQCYSWIPILPTGNSPFTTGVRHGVVTSNGGVFFGNEFSGNRTNNAIIRSSSTNYQNTSSANDLTFGTYANSQTVSITYNGSSRTAYVNRKVAGSNSASFNVQNTNTHIGYLSTYGGYLIGSIMQVYVFGTALDYSDLVIIDCNYT